MASLATVSRAGMVFVDIEDLGWKPLVDVWIEQKEDNDLKELLTEFINFKYLNKVLQVKKLQCKEQLVRWLENSSSKERSSLLGQVEYISRWLE